MTTKFIKKIKFVFVLVIAILLAGATVFGIYGLNNTADYKDGYELNVNVEINIGKAAEVLKTATDEYLSTNNVTYKEYALEKLDEGGTLIFKFTEDIGDKIDTEALENYIENAMQSQDVLKGLEVSADYYIKSSFKANNNYYVLIGAGVALLIAFIYALIMEKGAGAFAVAIVSISSILLVSALITITRVAAQPFIFASIVSTAALSALYSMGMINRFNEANKYSASNKKSFAQIAEEQTKASALGIGFISFVLIIFAIATFVLGPAYLQFMAIQTLLVVVASYLSAYFFTGFLWSKFKGISKKQYPEAKTAE